VAKLILHSPKGRQGHCGSPSALPPDTLNVYFPPSLGWDKPRCYRLCLRASLSIPNLRRKFWVFLACQILHCPYILLPFCGYHFLPSKSPRGCHSHIQSRPRLTRTSLFIWYALVHPLREHTSFKSEIPSRTCRPAHLPLAVHFSQPKL